MHLKEKDNFMLGVQHALGLPIRTRCAELTVLLDRGTLLELHNFFPVLIDNIFGPQGTLSWGLRSTTEAQTEDFRQLQHFLSPMGPMFKLIYTLLKDSNIKYEFPLTYLPSKIRQFLENSQAHPFYSELVNVNPHTKQFTSVLLNPFDYYIFHFAYHLINPWQQRAASTITSWNTVYYILCCDYIIHFLPTDPSVTVQPVIYYNGKNPLQAINSTLDHMPRSSGLITAKTFSNTKEDTFQKNLDVHHPRNDIWRSETVLTVFGDMWLQNNQVNLNLNNSFTNESTPRLLYHNELPTGEYMRIVRVFIKQLHSFTASARADDTPLAELKKIAIPMIQGKFYIFLRNLIHQWPLDGSFRLVLELWLTYVQPWRYPPNNLIRHLNKKETNPDIDDIAVASQPSVEREHLPFIAENLLVYIVIFQQLLPRFSRVDLVSPKMSLMLYRITKVFDQPNLPNYLREIEQCVEENNSPTHKFNSNQWKNNLPPLSPTSNWSTNTDNIERISFESSRKQGFSPVMNSTTFVHTSVLHFEKKWSAVLRQKIFELEGPNFCYKPLFCDPPAPEIFSLIIQIKRSIVQAQELVRMKEQEEAKLYSGFWGQLKYLFQPPTSNDEFTLRDREKVPIYLQFSLQNLMDMFNIIDDVYVSEPEQTSTSQSTSFDMSNHFNFLTPEKVKQRIRNIKYEGDPDLHPIRTSENAFLVRIFYQISQRINESYGPAIYRLYHSPKFSGRLCRQYLCPPMTVYRYDKTVHGSPRVSSNLPPRVSLRFLASYRFLGNFFFGALLAKFFGYSFELYFIFVLVITLSYKCFKALLTYNEASVRHNYPTEGFGNISFNDSFS